MPFKVQEKKDLATMVRQRGCPPPLWATPRYAPQTTRRQVNFLPKESLRWHGVDSACEEAMFLTKYASKV